MIVTKGWLATWTVIAGVSMAACNAPPSHADTPGLTCEHRGLDHIERHGGKVEDDLYHRTHHERLTCDGKDEPRGDFAPYEKHDDKLHADERHDDDDKDKRHDDPALPGHVDKPGYGCFWLRCG